MERPGLINLIESKLGIDVELAQVRLMLRKGDCYVWKPLAANDEPPPENETSLAQNKILSAKKKRLFTKQLSKFLIGAYKELYRGINVSIAEPKPGNIINTESEGGENIEVNTIDGSTSNVSFTSRINKLQTSNTRLAHELDTEQRVLGSPLAWRENRGCD